MPSKKLSEKKAALVSCLVAMMSGNIFPAALAETAQAGGEPAAAAVPPASPQSVGALPAAAPSSTQDKDSSSLVWKPGKVLSMNTDTEDLVATYDIELARQQVISYPDSPEASFILAVALTRTSRVEEALKEVQRSRKLAESKGGPAYFDKMIASYEQLLKSYPKDNQVRYGLSWAYYMKAYLLARYSRKSAIWKAAQAQIQAQAQAQAKNSAQPQAAGQDAAAGKAVATAGSADKPGIPSAQAATPAPAAVNSAAVAQLLSNAAPRKNDLMSGLTSLTGALASLANNQPPPLNTIPHIPGALEKADPADIPQIRKYYEMALQKLDELLLREPDDIWATVYRAHLKAEYTGNLEEAMTTWRACQSKYPSNPAAYFFLGEGYLKQGNLKESINNVSKAIALRALGN